MSSPRAGCIPGSVALFLLPVIVVLASPSAIAAKPGKSAKPAAAAKHKAASKSSNEEASSTPAPGLESSGTAMEASSSKYETPSPAPAAEAPAGSTVGPPIGAQGERPATPAAASESGTLKDVPPSAEKMETPRGAQPAQKAEEDSPVVAEPQPVYVEHLGPAAYPGKLRGLYGGSMWLEPSFNGLQWPYMAKSGVGISGSIWVDSGYEKITRGAPQVSPTTMWLQQGRAVLRATPTYASGEFFIQGQVELVGNLCQVQGSNVCLDSGTFSTDDLWIRVGRWNVWDLKVGRFEGWELYHTGMGLDVNTLERLGATNIAVTNAPGNLDAPQFYGVSYLHDRPAAGLGVGYIALHAYATSTLRFELLGELGTDNSRSNQGHNILGGRPSMILDLGWLKFKAGAEYEKQTRGTPQFFDATAGAMVESKFSQTRKGLGGSLQFIFAPYVEFGASFGLAKQLLADNDQGIPNAYKSFTTTSVGGFVNFRPADLWLLGAGVNWTTLTDSFFASGSPDADFADHLQTFGAVQYLLARQLFIKAVIGYSRADFLPSDQTIRLWSSDMYSGRVRLMYLY